jgi:hypothetical protein
MAFNPYRAPQIIEPETSWQLTGFVFGTHALVGLFCLFMFPAFWWVRLLLFLVVLVSAYYYARLHVYKHSQRSVVRAVIDAENKWEILLADHSVHPARLHPTSFMSTFLMVLNFQTAHKRLYTLLVFPDAIPVETARRLRVRLKLTKT